MRAPQAGEGVFIDLLAFALTHERFASAVGNEAEPVEVLEQRAFVLRRDLMRSWSSMRSRTSAPHLRATPQT
jgi:hypothetical protein